MTLPNKLEDLYVLARTRKKKFIAEGAGRRVYDLGNGYVVKLARNKRGKMENFNEHYIYQNAPEYIKKHLNPVVYLDEKYLIAPKVETLQDYIKRTDNKDNIPFDDYVSFFGKSEFLEFLLKTYQLDDFDLGYMFNWGIINGDIVLIDYGYTYLNEYLD